ncbi:MAG: PilC/PilY family type IV pilus protein [Pseudomonadota bacterium]
MRPLKHMIKSLLLASFATLWCTSPVWGDDTEIFFGDVDTANIRPNVLFVIDTSGSMSSTVSGTGKDRLDNVKDAMFTLLEELNNVNVGLMRFTNPGGPVLYPVTNIDEVVPGTTITLETTVSSGNDDAQEFPSSGLMATSRDSLRLVENSEVELPLYTDFIAASIDDAEERNHTDDPTGAVSTTGSLLLLWGTNTAGTPAQSTVGLSFTGAEVPAGATITNAYIRFYSWSGDANQIALQVRGQPGVTPDFSATTNDITNRARTTAAVDWLVPNGYAFFESYDTPNIASVVQEIVDDPAWDPNSGEDDLVFFFDAHPTILSTGFRFNLANDFFFTVAPQLYVEYYEGATAPVTEVTNVGLRFDNLNVPRGATVTDAFVTFTSDRDFSDTHALSIDIEETGNGTSFSSSAGDITSRPVSGSPISWNGTTSTFNGGTYTTPNIAPLISTAINRGDWCGGNAVNLIITGTDGALPAWSADGNGSLAPRLTVRYDHDSIPDGGSCQDRTIFRAPLASVDDAYEEGSTVSVSDDFLQFYDQGSSKRDAGVRFRNIDIPKNAVIKDAYIEFTASDDDENNVDVLIQVEASDDAQFFTQTDGSVSDRNFEASTVTWSITNDWDTGDVNQTPDISSLVSAVVSRPGWDLGNSMMFRLSTSDSDDREAASFDGDPDSAPRLVVNFEDDGSGIQDRTVRDLMEEIVIGLNHNGLTPIQDTLYEAAQYYTGGNVLYGASRGFGPYSYARVSAAESMVDGTFQVNTPDGCSALDLNAAVCASETITGVGDASPQYDTPIESSCQRESHIILLTDGSANSANSTSLIPTFTGEACLNEPTVTTTEDTSTTPATTITTSTALSSGELCVKDLVSYLSETDLSPDLGDQQIVKTHTIGFNFSSQWLADVAEAGGGTYAEASQASDLVEEIKAIVGDVKAAETTFVSPVAAVNEFNQLEHLDQVYFALFRPEETPLWRGNVKRFRIDGNGDFVDANDNVAVDATTGFFFTSSQSFWSSEVDGAAVDIGGAEENVPSYVSRNLYTYYDGTASNVLSNSANALTTTNTDLTQSMFDVSLSTSGFEDLIEWVRGRDVLDEDGDSSTADDRYIIGDPLHSRPVAVTYGGTEENPDVQLFFGTNTGVIHSVDAASGQETFGFIPEEFLTMQQDLFNNQTTTTHPYGMDDTATVWQFDEDRDDIDPSDAGDFVRLYMGMRRGGRGYYALDVTDRSNPEVMFRITGGQVQANGDDFRELGQTWSRPIKTQIIVSGDTEPRDVLIFSAGYDDAQDDALIQTPDNMGRGFYIIDAVTGALIWSGGATGAQAWTTDFAGMDYSFPDSVGAVDINLDGLADMWFAADTGGQLWRFDIRNGQTLANLVTGGVIADLGVASGTNEESQNRRFFATPSVALQRDPEDGSPQMAVILGSGFRPSPLSTIATNRLYSIRQEDVFSPPGTYTSVEESQLFDVTGTASDTPLESTDVDAFNSSAGWFYTLPQTGEKAFTTPLVLNNEIIITTYTPGASNAAACQPTAGASRVYGFDLTAGALVFQQDLSTVGLPPEPTINFIDGTASTGNPPPGSEPGDDEDAGGVCPSGTEVVEFAGIERISDDTWCNTSQKTYWSKER